MSSEKGAHEHTGSAEAIRPSLRDGLRLIPCSPRRDQSLFVTVAPRKRELPENLTPAIGASGPHDFTVRERLRSSFASATSTASHRACRDVAQRPSYRAGYTEYAGDLGQKQSGIFFAKGLDRILRERGDLPDGLICRTRFTASSLRLNGAKAEAIDHAFAVAGVDWLLQ